jgi:hypothetical protein
LHPATIRPSSTSAAAPTGKPEYGAYAVALTSIALRRNAFQSIFRFMPGPSFVDLNASGRHAEAADSKEGNPNIGRFASNRARP